MEERSSTLYCRTGGGEGSSTNTLYQAEERSSTNNLYQAEERGVVLILYTRLRRGVVLILYTRLRRGVVLILYTRLRRGVVLYTLYQAEERSSSAENIITRVRLERSGRSESMVNKNILCASFLWSEYFFCSCIQKLVSL